MMFMVIERFKNRDAKAIYDRFLKEGRMTPEGLTYQGSWVEANFERCFQLIECSDANLLQQWVVNWQDLIEFEFIPVAPSDRTVKVIEPLLNPSIRRESNRS
jgi:hypothetical protein